MASDIPESDWRHFREVHRKLLDKFASRSLEEIVAVIEAKKGTAHEKYLKVYELIHEHDEDMGRAFDDVRRSTAVMQLGIMTDSYTHLRAHETPEHLVCRLLLEKKKK